MRLFPKVSTSAATSPEVAPDGVGPYQSSAGGPSAGRHCKLNQAFDGDGVAHLEILVPVGGWILLVVAHKGQTLMHLSVIVARDIHRIFGVFTLQIYSLGGFMSTTVFGEMGAYLSPIAGIVVALFFEPCYILVLHALIHQMCVRGCACIGLYPSQPLSWWK